MLLQALVQLDEAANKKSPAAPERAQRRLELRPASRIKAEAGAQREADAANKIPQADVPAQHARIGLPPVLLRLDHEQRARDNKAGAADDLRRPVRAVERLRRRQACEDGWQRRQPRDPEHRRAKQLRRARQEPDLVEVVLAQVLPRWEPHPRAAVWPVVHAVVLPFLVQLFGSALNDFAALVLRGNLLWGCRQALLGLPAFANKVGPVLVVVCAAVFVRNDL